MLLPKRVIIAYGSKFYVIFDKNGNLVFLRHNLLQFQIRPSRYCRNIGNTFIAFYNARNSKANRPDLRLRYSYQLINRFVCGFQRQLSRFAVHFRQLFVDFVSHRIYQTGTEGSVQIIENNHIPCLFIRHILFCLFSRTASGNPVLPDDSVSLQPVHNFIHRRQTQIGCLGQLRFCNGTLFKNHILYNVPVYFFQ